MRTSLTPTLSGSTPGRGPQLRSGACAISRWRPGSPAERSRDGGVHGARHPRGDGKHRARGRGGGRPVAPWTQPPWRSRRPPVTRDDRRGAAAGAHHRHRHRQRHRRERRLVVAGAARRQVRDRPHQAIRRVRPAGEPCRRGHAVPAAEGDLAATACQERSVRALRARGNGAGTRGRAAWTWPAEDPFRIGISFGNNSGGWDICERGFEEYYQQGPPMINPWQATAWFPTAPQGFVSIQYNIRGWSKSFACDRASGGSRRLFRTARAALGTQRRDARGRIGSARDQAGSRCPRVDR